MKTSTPASLAAPRLRPVLLALGAAALLSACSVAPVYERPSVDTPAAWKEAAPAAGWVPAAPADHTDRRDWWSPFADTELDGLLRRVAVSNQNVAAAVAAYAQARATLAEQRAGWYPSVSLGAGVTRAGGKARSSTGNTAQASLSAGWEPDLWGKLGANVSSAQASAQASQAELASATLSAQATLATSYFSLREADAEIELVQRAVEGYERSLQITQNRYTQGVAAKSDVLQAQTQLANTRADLATLRSQRAQYEHAIAVLVGVAPGNFTLAPAPWVQGVPAVPAGLPSTLLQRRPDIAAAERAVAAANADIGVQRSAYFPSLTLSASAGTSGPKVGDLFDASRSLWSVGLSIAQTVFDAGAIAARVEGARAAHDAAVARYRQAVLAAFQDVEDQLSSSRTLSEQLSLRQQASEAADETERQVLNRYRAGQVNYTEVVTAQASALSARRALVQLQASRQTAAVALMQALGGGWEAAE
jgi:NodT family efflux transporter outer membrane factor (OMF) lipoprotein